MIADRRDSSQERLGLRATGNEQRLSQFSRSGLLNESDGSVYDLFMIRIRFPDSVAKRRALGRLAGRFSFTSWATGEMLVPESALGYLAVEGIPFSVEGPATYEQNAPALRGSAAAAVQ